MGPQALLLAAGLGSRLRPLTDALPKCLVPVCGRPLLGYWLELLNDAGFERIVVNTHHHADLVRSYVSNSPFAARVMLSHEETLLGTGGTLLANREHFDTGPILVAHADNLSVFDPTDFLLAHSRRPQSCVMTMMTFDTDDPRSCGIVELDERGVVAGFHEKVPNPPGRRANAAIYAFEQDVVREIAKLRKEVVDLSTEILPGMLGRAFAYHNARFHRDIGTLASLAKAQSELPQLCPGWLQTRPEPGDAWVKTLQSASPATRGAIQRLLSKALPTA